MGPDGGGLGGDRKLVVFVCACVALPPCLWAWVPARAGSAPHCFLILGFAVGVQQLHPTLVQRTYG